MVLATQRGTGAVHRGARHSVDVARAPAQVRPPIPLSLDEVHVWRAHLDAPPATVAQLHAVLAPDERDRAGRFRFERDRDRYIVGRGLLRHLLARYLDLAPAAVPLRYGDYDKPLLACPGPWFNLSHSGPVALYALSAAAEVGVDVELAGNDLSRELIAERFFSPGEVTALRSLPVPQQPRAFLACWTRKEAFLKARGDGLQLALDSFDVELAPDRVPAVLRTAWSAQEPAEWQIADLSDEAAGFVAAVTQRARGWHVRNFDLTDTHPGTMPRQEDQ